MKYYKTIIIGNINALSESAKKLSKSLNDLATLGYSVHSVVSVENFLVIIMETEVKGSRKRGELNDNKK